MWAEPQAAIDRFQTVQNSPCSLSIRGAYEDFNLVEFKQLKVFAPVHSTQLMCSVPAHSETPTPSGSCWKGEKGTPASNTSSL